MNTARAERSVADLPADGGGPARRAVIRWAWRLFRREWRQQVLVLALVTVAVTAMTIGVALASNAQPHEAGLFGSANQRLTIPGNDPQLNADIAAAKQAFGPVEVIAHQTVTIPGSVATVDLRAQDPAGRFGGPALRLDSGRYPTGAGEVAFTGRLAAALDLKVGDVWHERGATRRVVGTVENPQNLLDAFALVAPGQANPPDQVTLLLDATPAQLSATPIGNALVATRAPPAQDGGALLVLVLATIGLVFVGLVAAAGFTVMAQRRQRAFGMLGALGATDQHVQLVMLANGGVVGGIAAVSGAAIGVASWIAVAPKFENVADHRIDALNLPWWAIVTAMLLAVLTAITAAWWPARSASRIPIVAALSSRPPRPQPARRFAASAAAFLAVGLGLLAIANQKTPGGVGVPGNRGKAFVIFGILATALGVLLLGPLGIRALGAAARRSPIAIRLALRDLARYQARSAAALGAISLAIFIAVVVAISPFSAPTTANLPPNQLIVHIAPSSDARISINGESPVPLPDRVEYAAIQARVDALAGALHAQTVLPLTVAIDPSTTIGLPSGVLPAGTMLPAQIAGVFPFGRATAITPVDSVYVATPALLHQYGIAASGIDAKTQIITSLTRFTAMQLMSGFTGPTSGSARVRATPGGPPSARTVNLRLQTVRGLPSDSSDPDTLLTTSALRSLGLEARPSGWLIQTARPLTGAQISSARQSAAAAGVSIETRPDQNSLLGLRDGSTTAGILLALGVLAMTVGLIRSETANDLRTLAAAGATSVTRRTLTGATAGALAILGVVLGTGGAYLGVIAWHRSDLSRLSNVPVLNLVVIVVGLPVIAAVGGWLLAGREPAVIGRHALE